MLAVGVLAVLATSVSGQTTATAAGVGGRVTDASGAAIGRAVIVLSNADTGQRLTTTTDGEGRYRLLSIPPGRHRVMASAPGFAPAAVDITLALGESANVPLTLRVAALAETVTPWAAPRNRRVSNRLRHGEPVHARGPAGFDWRTLHSPVQPL